MHLLALGAARRQKGLLLRVHTAGTACSERRAQNGMLSTARSAVGEGRREDRPPRGQALAVRALEVKGG